MCRENIVDDYNMPSYTSNNMGLTIPTKRDAIDSEATARSLRSLKRISEKEQKELNRARYLSSQGELIQS